MLIIDANQIGLFSSNDSRVSELLNALENSSLKLAVGGTKLDEEYSKHSSFYDYVLELQRAGKVYIGDLVAVDTKEVALRSQLKSDDPHIIALAQESGARLLCSDDRPLHSDFTNPVFINSPRGKVWHSSRPMNTKVRKTLIDWCEKL